MTLLHTRHALALLSLSCLVCPAVYIPPTTTTAAATHTYSPIAPHSLTHTHSLTARKTPCRQHHAAAAAAPISTIKSTMHAPRLSRAALTLPLSLSPPPLAASIHPAVAVTFNRQPPVHLSLAPRAGYPASCLHRVPAYLYFVLHHDFTYSHVPPTHLPPQRRRQPPLASAHSTSLPLSRPPPCCHCPPLIRQPPANLTSFVFLVLDQRSLLQPTALLGYHDALLPLLWPSYSLKAVLQAVIYRHDTARHSLSSRSPVKLSRVAPLPRAWLTSYPRRVSSLPVCRHVVSLSSCLCPALAPAARPFLPLHSCFDVCSFFAAHADVVAPDSSPPSTKRSLKPSPMTSNPPPTARPAAPADLPTLHPAASLTAPAQDTHLGPQQPLPSPTSRKRKSVTLGHSHEPMAGATESSVEAHATSAALPPPPQPDAVQEPKAKKSRTNTPWTPAEELRLKQMRDAGNSWSEIAKVRPCRSRCFPFSSSPQTHSACQNVPSN